jgi:hypothetical protein
MEEEMLKLGKYFLIMFVFILFLSIILLSACLFIGDDEESDETTETETSEPTYDVSGFWYLHTYDDNEDLLSDPTFLKFTLTNSTLEVDESCAEIHPFLDGEVTARAMSLEALQVFRERSTTIMMKSSG